MHPEPGGNESACETPIAMAVPCAINPLLDGEFAATHRAGPGLAAHLDSDLTRAGLNRQRKTEGSTCAGHRRTFYRSLSGHALRRAPVKYADASGHETAFAAAAQNVASLRRGNAW